MKDYQKYINALRKCAKEHDNDRTSTGHIIVSDLCKDTANLLEELEQEPRWIPVSERLPEFDDDGYSTYVLVSFSNSTLPCIGQLRKTDGENHWYEGDDEKALDSFDLHVNAWMPLPEPYEDEEEEEEE